MLLTGLGWGLAYGANVVKVTAVFVLLHFLLTALVVATMMYFLVGRLLGPGVAGLPTFLGRGRRRGLFAQTEGGAEQLEFGYCFDVAIRAFFPVWVFLYVAQFVLMPVVAKQYWLSLFLGNTLYVVAFGYYTVITFLGYNGELQFIPFIQTHAWTCLLIDVCLIALPFLKHTELLLAPTAALILLYIITLLLSFSMPRHFAPVLLAGRIGIRHV